MKGTIYTIPINDAFDADCECLLCVIENKVKNEIKRTIQKYSGLL